MNQVIGCFVSQHDYRLSALAVLICAMASFACVRLLRYAKVQSGYARDVWVTIAAATAGMGVWSTHFIAMLAYEAGLPVRYDLPITVLSLLLCVVIILVGFRIAIDGERTAIGGLIVGAGISVMHFTGMMAIEVQARESWDIALIAASLGFSLALSAVALPVILSRTEIKAQLLGPLLLVLGVGLLHFTAMAAMRLTPDPTLDVVEAGRAASGLALGVALASTAIVLIGLAALYVDLLERRKLKLERHRLMSLADASAEGLLICDDRTVLIANGNLTGMLGRPSGSLNGSPVQEVLSLPTAELNRLMHVGLGADIELIGADGLLVPAQIRVRAIDITDRVHLAVSVRDLRTRLAAEAEIRRLEHHDQLTGLANRAHFKHRLDGALESASAVGGKVAVLCLDIDRFSRINDLYGQNSGDALLRALGLALQSTLARGEVAARFGGDEFVVFAPVAQTADAEDVARRMLACVSETSRDYAGGVSASVGVAIHPEDAPDRMTLLRNAGVALLHAKAEPGSAWRFFERAMAEELNDRRLMEHDLRAAAALGELFMVYQPQACARTGRIQGFEALIRWRRGGDLVSPATFIPIAEECGAISAIGEWALRRVCGDAASWTNPLYVAVNVSPVQLLDTGFVELLHALLLETGLPPTRLEVEITETALIRDFLRTLTALRRLKALGVRIAMDDFGTGYSSLSNLRAFPFDKIKIDRSFVSGLDQNGQSAAIVRSVIGLGRGLGLPVTAEGVETESELSVLREEGCEGVQGYHIGRPAPIETFEDLTRPGAAAPSCALASVA
ncbi:diguanylate cyclase [Methylopila jiangsuensis]|uniref:Diguanylate cyclase n=1 Tax=Methylopila jiangsuensis TaxID=586230 RepID=A0A9W6N2Q8_9HYPH|nr:EAL domain-containing protein [Methylopila jiangsuensis]MDR6285702.1 diguanylate cyclase (GGDEF)-like protein [Methylopila jiangsuensis]GLK75461.1 diguanylate cyclase [Methylopila jiangsuensis]